jgi:hypothetical protein
MIRMPELLAIVVLCGLVAAGATGWYLYRFHARRSRDAATQLARREQPPVRRPGSVRATARVRQQEGAPPTVVTQRRPSDRYARGERANGSPPWAFQPVLGTGAARAGSAVRGATATGGANGDHPHGREQMDASPVAGTLDHAYGAAADLPVDTTVTQEQLWLAVRAVLIHTAQRWPSGVYCANDRSPYPCRMRRWGERVLLSAGWRGEDIAALARQADVGPPPWLAGTGPTGCPTSVP